MCPLQVQHIAENNHSSGDSFLVLGLRSFVYFLAYFIHGLLVLSL